MALTLKSTGIATALAYALVNDAGTIKLFRASDPTNPLTVGGGLTVGAGTITAESTPTTYNGHSVYEITVASGSLLTLDTAISAPWASGVSVFAAITSLTAATGNQHITAGTTNPNNFVIAYGKSTAMLYGTTVRVQGTTVAPTGGTDFSVGIVYKNSTANCQAWYGLAGSTGGFENPVTSGGWAVDDSTKYLFSQNATPSNTFAGKVAMIALFSTPTLYTATEFDALHSDPIGTLFDTGGTSVAPLAMGAYSRMRNG